MWSSEGLEWLQNGLVETAVTQNKTEFLKLQIFEWSPVNEGFILIIC